MLETVQHWIEEGYRLEPAGSLNNFLIDHDLLVDYLGASHPLCKAEEVVLLMEQAQDLHLGLYLDQDLLAQKQTQLSHHQCMTVIEGVSHLLLLLHRARHGQEVSQLELELQAEIDKFLFVSLSSAPGAIIGAKLHLKKKANLKKLDPERKITYENARRLAYRYCLKLEQNYLFKHSWDPLWENLRHFYRMSHWEKLRSLGLP